MSDKKTPLNTIREALHGALLKCAQYAQNPARDPQEVDYALCVLVPEEIEEALAALRSMEGSEPVDPAEQELADHYLYMGWLSARPDRPWTDEDAREAFIHALMYARAHPPAPAVVEPWISVEDRLPDLPIIATDGSRFSETVLVFRSKAPKHTCVGESQYGDYGSGDAGWLGESGQGVTHWMPLPSPPSPSTT